MDNRVILVFFYVLAYWPLLLNNGVFWDDWVLYHQAPRTVLGIFSEQGSRLAGYLDVLLVSAAPVVAKWVVFTIYLVAMLVVYQILLDSKLFGRRTSLLLALFAAVIPYNAGRIAAMNALYALCYLLFVAAFLALMRYLAQRKLSLRVLALLLFFLSFGTASLMVFYALPLVYIAYHERASLTSLKGVAKTCWSYADFILIPLVFFAMKSVFFVPHGIYAGYNTIELANIARSPHEYFLTLSSSFLDVIGRSFTTAAGALGFAIVLLIVTYLLLANRTPAATAGTNAQASSAKRFLFGALLFYLGVLPYLAIGRDGATFGREWESRDQLLLGIGAAFMLFYGLRFLFALFHFGVRPQRVVFSILVAAFLVVNVATYLQFQADWFKQIAFMESVRGMPQIRDNTSFAVDDRAAALNAMNRHVQFYEYNGMLRQVFGTETRLAAPASDIAAFSDPAFLAMCVERPQYSFKDYVPGAPTQTIVIDVGGRGLSLASMARLFGEELLRPAAFREHVKQTLVVRVEPAQ